MIYIAESGSTKCDAVFLNTHGEEVKRLHTIGFNPYFHNEAFVTKAVQKIPEIVDLGKQVSQVFFYGAGCSNTKLCARIERGLQPGFPKAQIVVDHDLSSAAFATYQDEPAITCILGTGSNCVYFDGQKVVPAKSGLGFILGDEGSASNIGKKLIRLYHYELIPEPIRNDFDKTFGLSHEEIRRRVYEEPNANVFLGSFAPFVQKHINHPLFYQLVFDGFKDFIETQVLQFNEAHNCTIHFIGSIAYHFQDILRDTLNFFDLKMGTLIKSPLDNLIEYHKKYILDLN